MNFFMHYSWVAEASITLMVPWIFMIGLWKAGWRWIGVLIALPTIPITLISILAVFLEATGRITP